MFDPLQFPLGGLSGPSVFLFQCPSPHPINRTDSMREHIVNGDDEHTQVGKQTNKKKSKEQGTTVNIFNVDQFCSPISVFGLKPSFSPQRNSYRTGKKKDFMRFIVLICLYSPKSHA